MITFKRYDVQKETYDPSTEVPHLMLWSSKSSFLPSSSSFGTMSSLFSAHHVRPFPIPLSFLFSEASSIISKSESYLEVKWSLSDAEWLSAVLECLSESLLSSFHSIFPFYFNSDSIEAVESTDAFSEELTKGSNMLDETELVLLLSCERSNLTFLSSLSGSLEPVNWEVIFCVMPLISRHISWFFSIFVSNESVTFTCFHQPINSYNPVNLHGSLLIQFETLKN